MGVFWLLLLLVLLVVLLLVILVHHVRYLRGDLEACLHRLEEANLKLNAMTRTLEELGANRSLPRE